MFFPPNPSSESSHGHCLTITRDNSLAQLLIILQTRLCSCSVRVPRPESSMASKFASLNFFNALDFLSAFESFSPIQFRLHYLTLALFSIASELITIARKLTQHPVAPLIAIDWPSQRLSLLWYGTLLTVHRHSIISSRVWRLIPWPRAKPICFWAFAPLGKLTSLNLFLPRFLFERRVLLLSRQEKILKTVATPIPD